MSSKHGVTKGVVALVVLTGVLALCPIRHPALDAPLSKILGHLTRNEIRLKGAQFGLVHGLSGKEMIFRKPGKFRIKAENFHMKSRMVMWGTEPHLQLDLSSKDLSVGQDVIADMLHSPHLSLMHFDQGEAAIQVYYNRIHLARSKAMSQDAEVGMTGEWYPKSQKIDAAVHLRLSPAMTLDIPESLKRTLLGEDPKGFKTFDIKISGTTRLPSIEIASDRFRFKSHY
jgi:hypothetical protein